LVREEITKQEVEIEKLDAEIMKLNSRLEAHKKGYRDNDSNDSFVNAAIRDISQLREKKARYETKLAELLASAAAMAGREKSLQSEIESERAMIKQLIERIDRERKSPTRELPPLKNAEVKIFQLVNSAPLDMANIIDSIFSPAQLRLSIDERTKSLVVMGDKESLEIVEALLLKMDQPADGAADQQRQHAADKSADRSLLLRVFWLADDLPDDERQDPTTYLPKSVLKALHQLGLKAPRLVTQTVNSLAVGDAAEVEFATQVPAVLFGQHATLQCAGSMRPMNGDRTGLNIDIHVSGPAIHCDLKGSLATPLGHYMVLGTANSVIADPATVAAGGYMGGEGMGMERGVRFMGRGGYAGRGGEGGAAFGAPVDPATGQPAAMEGEGMGQPAEPKYNTSRFAFVVQVIEGESYAADE
jgi:hypothetical protein